MVSQSLSQLVELLTVNPNEQQPKQAAQGRQIGDRLALRCPAGPHSHVHVHHMGIACVHWLGVPCSADIGGEASTLSCKHACIGACMHTCTQASGHVLPAFVMRACMHACMHACLQASGHSACKCERMRACMKAGMSALF
eukprot:366556-Chlamydomonas_euryale.AAC.7